MIKKNNRANRGVLVCAQSIDGGGVRITLDDVTKGNDEASRWNMDCFFTSKDYDEKTFNDLDFDDKELADFGYHILARLYAYKSRGES